MARRTDTVWKDPAIAESFISRLRAAVPFGEAQLGIMAQIAETGTTPLDRFLDLGCGGGALGLCLLQRHPEATGVFADFSGPMLDHARANTASYPNCTVTEADFAHPSWVAQVSAFAPYDAVVSGYAIHHQPDGRKQQIYAEILTLLRPGGWFVNVEHVAPASPMTTELFETAIIDNLVALEVQAGGTRSRQEITGDYYNRDDSEANILAPTETQCGWLRELGYQDVDCYFKAYETAVFAGRRPE